MKEKKIITIPNGYSELVIINGKPKENCFKIPRELMANYEPKIGEQVIFVNESWFSYNGEIYHKTKDYAYCYIY